MPDNNQVVDPNVPGTNSPSPSQTNSEDFGTFSFQTQGDSGSSAVPTAPFETISYQEKSDNAGSNAPSSPVVSTAADVKIDQTDLSILREQQAKEIGQIEPQGSFMDRFQNTDESSAKVEPQVKTEIFASEPSEPIKTFEEKSQMEVPVAKNDSGYKMPDMPKPSILSKLIPIGFFLLVIALAIFVGLKFLPGLSGAKKTEIVWWGLWEDEKVIQPIITEYAKQKPNVTITYVKKSPKEYRALLQSSIARDIGPDVFRFHNTWTPMLGVELQPMPEKMKTEVNISDNYYPTVYFDLVKNNQILGLPLMYDGLAMFYNIDLFQNAGEKPATDWNETAKLAKKLTVFDESENIKVSGIALGNTSVEHWSDILGLMMLQNGADPSLPTDLCAKEAVEYYVSFSSDKDRVWDDTLGSSTLAFAGGRLAMYIAPSWQAFEIKKINPNLNFGVAAFPQVSGGKRYWSTYWAEGVSTKSKNPDEAWNFVKFLSEKNSLQLMYAESTKSSKERLFGEIYPRKDMASLLANDTLVGPFLTGAPQARSWYLASRTFDDGINDRMIKYYEDAINKIVRKEQSTEEALKTVSLGVGQVLKDYGLSQPVENKNCQTVSPQ